MAILLAPSGMGLASLFQSTSQFLYQATNLGVALSAVRQLSEDHEAEDKTLLESSIQTVRGWSMLTAALGLLMALVLGPVLSQTTFDWGDHSLHFVLLGPAVAMMALTGGETAILKATRQLGNLAFIQLANAVLALVISIPIYYVFGEAGIVPVINLMAFATLLLTARHSLRRYPVRWELFSLRQGSDMLRLGVAFTLAGIVGSGAEMFIRSFLNVSGDLDAVGLYNAGYMITITYAGLVFAAMESDYFPRLSAVNQDVEATNQMVNKQMEVSILMMAPLLTSLIILLPVLIPLLLSSQFLPIVAMTQVAALAMFLKAMTLPVAYITLARGLSLTYLVLESFYYVALVVFIILGYRHWGIWGTGLAITLAHLAEFLIINGYARWRYQYKQSSTVLKYGAVHLLIGLLAYILTMTVDDVTYWLLGAVLIVVSLSFSLWVLNQKRKSSSKSTRL
jgi:O-antigen/teichoic acid export membrane protein